MSKYYKTEYLRSDKFSDKNELFELYSNYHKHPVPAIRFSHLVYKKKVEKIIVKIIKDDTKNCEDLIDCLIQSSTMKLCSSKVFKSLICPDKCICSKVTKFNKLYEDLTDLIVENQNILNKVIFVTNYSVLIRKTGVYNNRLYEILDRITDETNNFLPVINLIIRAELFSMKYYDLLQKIIEKSTSDEIQTTCNKIKMLIKVHRNKCSHIKDNIYISDINYAINNVTITDNNFEYVISVTNNDIVRSEKKNIRYIKIPIPDNASVDFIDNTHEALEELLKDGENKKILCHCFSGISRSVLFTTLLIKSIYNRTFKESLSMIRKARPIAYPNREIVKQIRKKLKQNKDK